MELGLEEAQGAAMTAYAQFQRGEFTRPADAGALSGYFTDAHPYDVESSEARVIPGFLGHSDMLRLHRAAKVCADVRSTRNCDPFDFCGPDGHTVVYLHRDGFFEQAYASLCRKLVDGMRMQGPLGAWGDPDAALGIRCVEYHTYPEGSGHLLPGHCDRGSELTMSVLLSHSKLEDVDEESDSEDEDCNEQLSFDGGRFVTFTEGQLVAHELSKGDAILFRSEKLHNVAQVTRGIRKSLVIELWQRQGNVRDRYS